MICEMLTSRHRQHSSTSFSTSFWAQTFSHSGVMVVVVKLSKTLEMPPPPRSEMNFIWSLGSLEHASLNYAF